MLDPVRIEVHFKEIAPVLTALSMRLPNFQVCRATVYGRSPSIVVCFERQYVPVIDDLHHYFTYL